LLFRNPERIAATRKYIEDYVLDRYKEDQLAYEAQKAENDPEYLEYLIRTVSFQALDWTRNILEHSKITPHLNGMIWAVRDLSGCGLTLFTSDRPVVMTNGLAHSWANIVVPLGPFKAFVATNSHETLRQIKEMPRIDFIRTCNEKVLRYAQKYAWNRDDNQINAAKRHLSIESEVSRTFFDAPPLRSSDTQDSSRKAQAV
jgi:hypothetical protein